eukprot:TRINITY_DN16498_c0_g1_i1.p1 TRINITY_DN16498_c0_g1~~TRINITY_DN16498_c0_g1_i1.p1  ORF type:complete len:748 (-),score=218.19 TRINITY_DN16498_c0_g1_i1:127-2370(-)
MKVQDYGCEGSDSPDVCHWLVADVAAAKAKCKEDQRCGAFVITRSVSDGSAHSVWLKMRDSRYASSYAQTVEASLTAGQNVDTYVVTYGVSTGEPASISTQQISSDPVQPMSADSGAGSVSEHPSLDLSLDPNSLFTHHAAQDLQGHDYNCQSSQVGQGCAIEVASVQEAETTCKEDSECGEFVIFHTAASNGKYTTWFKVKEFGELARSMKPAPGLSTFTLKDMGPKPKFKPLFDSDLFKDFQPVTGADRGMWDGTDTWPGAPKADTIHEDKERIQAVRNAMKHAWDGYVKFAFGQDELKPVSNRGANWLGMGATIIDSLDTLWLMGLKNEFNRARTWVDTSFNMNVNSFVSFFETTIRCLGGLITAYELSDDRMFLDKARVLGDKLLKAFKPSPSGYPMAQINLNNAAAEPPSWTSGSVILAEIGTVQLEFKALSHHTGDLKYHRTAHAVYNKLESITPPNGLLPLFLQPGTGNFAGNQISLGAMGDSYYEYLIKLYLYTKRSEPQYLRMYLKSLKGILDKLIFSSAPSGLTYVAEMNNNSPVHKMDHLACFVPGMLAIGAQDSPNPTQVMKTARGIAETCYQMYARQRSGVAPEFINFGGNDFNNGANHNLLRPEALEAMFVMFRYTGDPIYREWGWKMFLGFEQSCKTPSGYSGLTDVTQPAGRAPKDDTQQSFFLAETLKYAFLLFADGDTIPLDKYVLNTEAHPLKMWDQATSSPPAPKNTKKVAPSESQPATAQTPHAPS